MARSSATASILTWVSWPAIDIGTTNVSLDTYDLASVMLPTAPRYNLNSLTAQLGLELEHAHRALDDAIASGRLYWALWKQIVDLPLSTLHEIVEASRTRNGAPSIVFEEALRARSVTALSEAIPGARPAGDRSR